MHERSIRLILYESSINKTPLLAAGDSRFIRFRFKGKFLQRIQ